MIKSKNFSDLRMCEREGREWAFPAMFPIEFYDSHSRVVVVDYLDESRMSALEEMYESYRPRGRANGLPPIDDEVRHKWIHEGLCQGLSITANVYGRTAAHAVLFPLPPEFKRAEFGIFVHQDFQGAGIGGRLTSLTALFAKLIGFKNLWLIVEPENLRAINIYSKIGFHIDGNIDSEIHMILDVAKHPLRIH